MLKRCYCKPRLKKFPTYNGCSVCDEWKTFSSFKAWFDKNHIDGYDIDKDILVKGNKIYGPDTCCFVPKRINYLFINNRKARGKFPIGVSYHSGHKKFQAAINHEFKTVHIGYYKTPEEAFLAYKRTKESYIQQLAKEYYESGAITKRVYDALMRYKIEISD